ncbi:MAG: type II CAAX endopeptidase family protein, partial [Planctomycetota bacterium]
LKRLDSKGERQGSMAETYLSMSQSDGDGDEDADAFLDRADGSRVDLDAALEEFRRDGISAFRSTGVAIDSFSSKETWPKHPEKEPRFLALVSVFLTLLSLGLLLSGIAANQDIARPEWTLEWLFTFPVESRALLIARSLSQTIVQPTSWFLLFPVHCALFWGAGLGFWSLLPALVATLCFCLVIGSLRVFLETWLRKTFHLSRLKNIQAAFTVIGLIIIYGMMFIAFRPPTSAFFVDLATRIPDGARFLPSGIALLGVADGGIGLPAAIALELFLAFAVLVGCTTLGARAIRDGLVQTTGSPHQGKRQSAKSSASLRRSGNPILAKDFALFRRDRNFFVQTIVLPVLMLVFQISMNPSFSTATMNSEGAATLAFGIAAYVLLFAGASTLRAEGTTLWLLYTFPVEIGRVLLRKAQLWATVGAIATSSVIAYFAWSGTLDPLEVITLGGPSLIGSIVYAYIACGIGVLGTDPLEQEIKRQLKPGMTYLYLALAAGYGQGLYSGGPAQRIVLVVLCSLLAYAIWQKILDRSAFFLDPDRKPKPEISLSDGLIAALAFFVFQSIIFAIYLAVDPPVEGTPELAVPLLVAFVGAGALVSLLSAIIFVVRRTPNAGTTLGLRSDEAGTSHVRSAIVGVGAGLLAAGIALMYMAALDDFPSLKPMLEAGQRGLFDGDGAIYFVVLAVVAAPLFEEYIFRGMVFRGLRRSLPFWKSGLASAAIFAVVHPPISMIPVFGLGFAAALSFERARLITAPIIAHVTYNAIVVAAQSGLVDWL